MNYPLDLSFKKLALAHQLSVTDASGSLIWYVKQKAFKFKEQVTVCADREQTRPLYEMNADRVLDFSARYTIRAAGSGMVIGGLQRRGMRSLLKSTYEVEAGGAVAFTIQEENPWIKVADALLCEIPFVGLLSGYMFHPKYLVKRAGAGGGGGGMDILRLEKQPAFLEGKFTIERLSPVSDQEETLILLAVMMTVLLERSRG